jgi:hypothetical protein
MFMHGMVAYTAGSLGLRYFITIFVHLHNKLFPRVRDEVASDEEISL